MHANALHALEEVAVGEKLQLLQHQEHIPPREELLVFFKLLLVCVCMQGKGSEGGKQSKAKQSKAKQSKAKEGRKEGRKEGGGGNISVRAGG